MFVALCWYAYSTNERNKDVFPEGNWVQGCGIIIFEISNTSVSTINQKNLAFFEQATVASDSSKKQTKSLLLAENSY
jgi:hypothetical protein